MKKAAIKVISLLVVIYGAMAQTIKEGKTQIKEAQ
jgi:hypothetical protein